MSWNAELHPSHYYLGHVGVRKSYFCFYPLPLNCVSRPIHLTEPIPVAARSKVWICDRSLAGIAGSNRTGDMDVSLF